MQLIQVLRTYRIVGTGEVNGASDNHAPTAGLVVVATSAMGLPKPFAPTNPVLPGTSASGFGRDTSQAPDCEVSRSSNGSAIATITRDGEPSSHDASASVSGRFR